MTCPWVCKTGRSPVTSPRTPQRSPSPTASGVLSPEPSESGMLSPELIMLSPELIMLSPELITPAPRRGPGGVHAHPPGAPVADAAECRGALADRHPGDESTRPSCPRGRGASGARPSRSRVAGKYCYVPAPSELDVRVAPHPAQVFTDAPRGTRPLWQQPSRYAPGADGPCT